MIRRIIRIATPRCAAEIEMAIIDTLKLARALRDKGGFTQDAAEATADALNNALGDDVATKSDMRLLQWQMGIMYALQIAILIKLFVH